MAEDSKSIRLLTKLNKGGRGATGFAGLKVPPATPSSTPEPTPGITLVVGEAYPGVEPLASAQDEIRGGEAPVSTEPAAMSVPAPPAAPLRPISGLSAAGSATNPRRTPGEVSSIISKLLGGRDLPESGRNRAVPISFDSQLGDYLFKRVLADQTMGQKTTQADLIREAIRTHLEPQIAANGKAILRDRHTQFLPQKSTVEVSESIYSELEIERNRYSNRDNRLTIPALIELRVLCWAIEQADWTD